MSQFKALILILAGMVSIQFGASEAKSLFNELGPLATTSLRVTFAVAILFFLARPWNFKWQKQWKIRSLVGYGLSLGLMNICFYLAIEKIPLGIAVAIEFVGPLTLSCLLSRRKMDFLWILFAVCGLVLIFPKQDMTIFDFKQNLFLQGFLFALAAGFFWAMYIVFGQSVAQFHQPVLMSFLGMFFAALVAFPVGLVSRPEAVLSTVYWKSGIYIALFSSAIPYLFEMRAMRDIPKKTFGILMSLEPVVAAVMGYFLLKETLIVWQMAGMLLIVVASIGSLMRS